MEHFKEFFAKDTCKTNPDFCDWVKKEVLDKNTEFVKENIKSKAASEPYWHQVNLLYKQMEGMREGMDTFQLQYAM